MKANHVALGLNSPNYELDPAEDYKLFARPDVDPAALAQSIQIDITTDIAPKRYLYGPWGSGKTHTLYSIVHILASQLPSIHFVHVECPTFGRNSTFQDFYRDGIMRSLGQSFVCGLFAEYAKKQPPRPLPEMLPAMTEDLGDEALALAVIKLYSQSLSPLTFWSWIAGYPVRGADLKSLEQPNDLTAADPTVLAGIIVAIGTVLQKTRGQNLILMLDELERIANTSADGQQTFNTAFTQLADRHQKGLSVLFGISVKSMKDAPFLFREHSPVTSRLGRESEINILPMPNEFVDGFIEQVIAYRRDANADLNSLIAKAQAAYPEQTFVEKLFPFSKEAIDQIKMRTGEHNTPREITYEMTRALGRAMVTDRCAVVEMDVAQ